MPQKCMECFRFLFDHLAWIKHQFLSSIRDSRKAGSLWGMMRGVGGVRKSIHQSWLPKGLGLGLGLLYWALREFRMRFHRKRPALFKSGPWTIHQSTTPSLSQTIWPRWASTQFLSLPLVQTLLSLTFGYSLSSEAIEEMKEAVTKIIDMLTQKDFHGAFQKLLEWYNKCIAAGGDYFKGD